MIVDSSAVLAIVFREPGFEDLLERMTSAGALAMGTPTLAETGIVLTARFGARADGMLERFLDEFDIVEIPFGEAHWREALEAFRQYGKGRHPAQLNFGDCLTYAVAKLAGEPLIHVGNDFTQTDLAETHDDVV